MSSIKKTAIIITLVSLICKLLGFVREIVLAYFFGTSYIVDSYVMATAIPTIIFGWISSIAVSYTPIYTDIREKNGIVESRNYTYKIISLVFLLSSISILLGILFNSQIVDIIARGFNKEYIALTRKFFYITIFSILFISQIQILIAYLNCNGKFILSNLSTLMLSTVQICFIFLSTYFNCNILLVCGVVTAFLFQFIVLQFYSRKNGLPLKFNFSFDKNVKQTLIIVIPIFISSMIDQVNKFVDKSFASSLPEGSISALNYANILQGFIYVIFTVAITTMIYPMLSKAAADNSVEKVKNILSKGINIIILLFIPVTVGAIILSKPAISFVFERGEFGSSSVLMTTSAFVMYSIGLLAVALRDVITKVFYSMQNTKLTLYIGVFAVLLNILFNFILVKPMAHAGLALATSLSAIISIPIFFIVLRKKLGNLGLKNTIILFIKSCVATVVMSIIVYFGLNFMISVLGHGKLSILLSLLVSAGIGGIIYFVLMIVMKVKEMEFFTDIFKKVIFKFKR